MCNYVAYNRFINFVFLHLYLLFLLPCCFLLVVPALLQNSMFNFCQRDFRTTEVIDSHNNANLVEFEG